jgi:23S rRNA (uracil1939-C5)-methyltransferase
MIARHEGTIVFVGGAIPGEVVEAEIEKTQRGTVWAATRQVLEPSPDRIAVADGGCGGAVFAHIAYERQRQIKSEIITDAFRRIGRITLDAPADVVASPVDGYRMRARLHRSRGKIGFFREGTHVLCDAAPTRQLRDDTIAVLRALEASFAPVPEGVIADIEVSENIDATQRASHFVLHPDAEPEPLGPLVQVDGLNGATYSHGVDQSAIELFGSPFVDDVIAGASLRRHVRSFFQGNRYLTPGLVDHVLSSFAGGPVLDLYAGVGLFSVTAAHAGRGPVTAVEGDRFSSSDLKHNASGHDVIVTADAVENFVARTRDRYAAVIVDPPRTGLSKEALAGVLALKSPALVYVSCDVATLARDTRVLLDAGYRMQSVRAFDLFPNTAHVETVISFSR